MVAAELRRPVAEPAIGALPVSPYDPAWKEIIARNPMVPRSLGAAAADDGGDGGDPAPSPSPDPSPSPAPSPSPSPDPAPNPTPNPAPTPPPKSGHFSDTIQDQQLREFAARFTTPAELAKTGLEFRQKLSNAIVKPGKGAKPEDIQAYHKALGVPDKPEDYQVTLPENLPEELKPTTDAQKAGQAQFLKAMHAVGATPDVVNATLGFYYTTLAQGKAQMEQQAKEKREEAEAELAQEWGEDFTGNINVAKRAQQSFGDARVDEFLDQKMVDGVKLGDHPMMLRLWSQVGRRTSEDGIHMGLDPQKTQSVEQELDGIMTKNPPGTPGYNDPAIQRRVAELNAQLYGDSPIVGSSGRSA